MAADFPTMKSGTVASYGTTRTSEYSTAVLTCTDGSDFRWKERGKLQRFVLSFKSIDDYERNKIIAHWTSARAAFDTTWGITLMGVTYTNCCYEDDELVFTEDASAPNRFNASIAVRQTTG